jgi:hypothetical protein
LWLNGGLKAYNGGGYNAEAYSVRVSKPCKFIPLWVVYGRLRLSLKGLIY